jgi:hypothetical protein
MSLEDHTKEEPSQAVRVECFMLCDYARENNGKIDILGGGWDQIQLAKFPAQLQFQLAIKLVVPTDMALQPLNLVLRVVEEASDEVEEAIEELRLIPTASIENVPEPEVAMFLPLRAQIEVQVPASYRIQLVADSREIAATRLAIVKSTTTSAAVPATMTN